MSDKIYTFQLAPDFNLMSELSTIDRFGGSWSAIEKREGHKTLKELKSIATIDSVASSTRIEGSKMTNKEVQELIFKNIKTEKLAERDQQEVLGYFKTLDVISESYRDIDITESNLKNLHNILMKFSEKDQWHKGNYKQLSNSVEATNRDGSKTTIFETTPPGFETENAMRSLIAWYNSEDAAPPVIKSALFVYDFLSIHPFQDGNGRLSRLLATLLLLKHGFSWIEYVSFENEIENRKAEYYNTLMECQQKRPGENVYPWVIFFLDCMGNIQNKLMQKLDVQKSESQLSTRERTIYLFVNSHPGCKSGELSQKLNIPLPSVKKILAEMVVGKFLSKNGTGAGTNYTCNELTRVKKNIVLSLTDENAKKEFFLKNKHSYLEFTKIILKPKFNWTKPDDWGKILFGQNLKFTLTAVNSKGDIKQQQYLIDAFNDGYHFEPVFSLNTPIHFPGNIWEGAPKDNEFPIKVEVDYKWTAPAPQFDLLLIYDAALE